MPSPAATLRALLEQPKLHVMPCCYDALSAKLIEQAGFGASALGGLAGLAGAASVPPEVVATSVAVVRLATGLGPRVAGLSAPQVPLALVPLLRPLVVVQHGTTKCPRVAKSLSLRHCW